ncbi:MAG: hypothetical protein CMJ83_20435 [Planctomycetes bacterium]|nr:hypothetical protein [Planctomycetota bacterium]
MQFLLVYIREAHPSDERRGRGRGRGRGPEVKQPKTFEERTEVASECVENLKLSMPAVIDNMKNTAGTAYAGFPDRLFLVDKKGKIAYAGARGPRGFSPEKLEDSIKAVLKNKGVAPRKSTKNKKSQGRGN